MSVSWCFREVCQDVFTNPRTVPTVKTVKYCTRPDPEATEVTTEAAIERLRQRPGPGGQKQTPVQSLVPPAQQEIQVRNRHNSDLSDIFEYLRVSLEGE